MMWRGRGWTRHRAPGYGKRNIPITYHKGSAMRWTGRQTEGPIYTETVHDAVW